MQSALVVVGTILFWLLIRRFSKKETLQLVPGPPSSSFFAGNLTQVFDRQGWNFHRHLFRDYGSVVRVNGLFNKPMLYVFDLDALQYILVKDFNVLDQSQESAALFHIMLGPGMHAVPAQIHHRHRKIINPAFSLNHLRSMMPMFYSITKKLCDTITSKVKVNKNATEIDVHHWVNRVAVELLAQGGLGCSFDSLTKENAEDEFAENMKKVISLALKTPVLRQILPFWLTWISPKSLRKLLQFAPTATVREFARLSEYVIKRSEEIYQGKKFALEQGDAVVAQQVGDGRDFMSLLMRANFATSEERMLEAEVVGQITLMTAAGTDTTANATTRVFHRLALRPDIQQKVRDEVVEASDTDGTIPFDILMQLPWLNAVIKETLRLDAPVPFSSRTVVKDIILPLSRPIRAADGTLMSKIPVPKGTAIFIGIYGCNLSKELWGEDVMDWKPERWLSPLPPAVSAIPGAHANLMSFSGGPHGCIGFKFGECEMKVITAVLLSRLTFDVTEKPIYWNISQVCYPSLAPDAEDTSLPLKVSLYQG